MKSNILLPVYQQGQKIQSKLKFYRYGKGTGY